MFSKQITDIHRIPCTCPQCESLEVEFNWTTRGEWGCRNCGCQWPSIQLDLWDEWATKHRTTKGIGAKKNYDSKMHFKRQQFTARQLAQSK